ncbi:hypothetical protein [Parasitella parasitica]|uniref:Uncharacterized protein n=1 Tax=Parasitella parasitica TaxID=35722 RepID=A0A0B7NT29_9FUNG|nr:hypothetical protein [Parasitella parasitica]
MPLLNKKRVPATLNISLNPKRQSKEVWYLRSTNEVFKDYESYINKLTLYHQAIWECERTGRTNLTYEQALESEKNEHERAEYHFSEVLRKSILNKVQFRTYVARILDIVPVQVLSDANINYAANSNSENQNDGGVNVPRQANGRLRFPDAFLLPTPQYLENTPSDAAPTNNEREEFITEYRYKVQLLDEDGRPLEKLTRIVEGPTFIRDGQLFNRYNVQCFIRDCCYRENYIFSPWLIKPSTANMYGIETALPPYLEKFQNQVFDIPSKRRRIANSHKTADEKEAEKQARREETLLQKAKMKEERDRLRIEKKKQAAVKYPVEDLDLPIYRKDPNNNWTLIDMSPQKYVSKDGIIPYPTGGRTERPIPHYSSPIPAELFDTFISTWAFLTVFAEPLKLTAYSVDEFEKALFHQSHQPKATVLVEYNACLLNVIIKERKDNTFNEIINGDAVENYLDSLEKSDDESDEENDGNAKQRSSKLKPESSLLPKVERGWRDKDHLRFAQKWDNKELRANYERRGWETTLIGCINDIATPELLPNIDELLCHLNPRLNSSAADREKQYPTLTVKQKLEILEFLVNVVNESTVIKNYMDYCQDQLTEFRKYKVELNKESKALAARRIEMDRRDKAEKSEEDDNNENEEGGSASENSDNSNEDSEMESDSSGTRVTNRKRKQMSRQEKLKQKQREREEKETQRKKQYAEQRQIAKVKNQEHRTRMNERRKLEEDERTIKRKEDHLEKNMRRYMTLRIRPLGKDRFNNRYIYLDNVGVSNTYGTGRLYVSSPTDIDIQMMMERDFDTANFGDRAWGYGGGRWFIIKLMQEQGFAEESEWLDKRMSELSMPHSSDYRGWWKYYSEPEEIEQLLSWLNPKGFREQKLKTELLKQQPNIIESFKKRAAALVKEENSPEEPATLPKRSTRAKSSAAKINKEHAGYLKEADTQQKRIDKLISEDKDEADIRKQAKVLEETLNMIPDVKKRLADAQQDLENCVNNSENPNADELKEANDVLSNLKSSHLNK